MNRPNLPDQTPGAGGPDMWTGSRGQKVQTRSEHEARAGLHETGAPSRDRGPKPYTNDEGEDSWRARLLGHQFGAQADKAHRIRVCLLLLFLFFKKSSLAWWKKLEPNYSSNDYNKNYRPSTNN